MGHWQHGACELPQGNPMPACKAAHRCQSTGKRSKRSMTRDRCMVSSCYLPMAWYVGSSEKPRAIEPRVVDCEYVRQVPRYAVPHLEGRQVIAKPIRILYRLAMFQQGRYFHVIFFAHHGLCLFRVRTRCKAHQERRSAPAGLYSFSAAAIAE